MELDADVLKQVEKIGGMPLLERLLRMFVELNPPRMESLRGGLAVDELDTVRRAAHSLGSSCGNIGANGTMELARALEHAAAGGRLEEVERLLPRLETEFDELLAAVDLKLESFAS